MLNYDIYTIIFDLLDYTSLINCREICREWNEIITETPHHSWVKFGNDLTKEQIFYIIELLNIKRVDISEVHISIIFDLKKELEDLGIEVTGFTIANLGMNLIKSVSINIGGHEIDRHYGEWLDIWNQLHIPEEKKLSHKAGLRNYKIKPHKPSKNKSQKQKEFYKTGKYKNHFR